MDQAATVAQAAPNMISILTSVGYLLIAVGVATLIARVGAFFGKG